METAILFSGGLDSMVASAKLIIEGRILHPLLVDNGTLSYLYLPKMAYRILRNRYPKGVRELVVLDGKYLFKRYVIENIQHDIRDFGLNLICVGCKFVMYSLGVAYCLNKRIKYMADGVSFRQSHLPEQNEKVLNWFDDFIREYDIEPLHPVKNVKTKKDMKHLALLYGLPPKALEPTCMFEYSFEYNINPDLAVRYLESKKGDMKKEIERLVRYSKVPVVRSLV